MSTLQKAASPPCLPESAHQYSNFPFQRYQLNLLPSANIIFFSQKKKIKDLNYDCGDFNFFSFKISNLNLQVLKKKNPFTF